MSTLFPASLTPGSEVSDAANYGLGFVFTVTDPVAISGVQFNSPEAQTGTGVAVYKISSNVISTGEAAPLASKMQDFGSGAQNVLFDAPITVDDPDGLYYVCVLLPSTAHWQPQSITFPYSEGGSITATTGGYLEGPTTLTPGSVLLLGAGSAPTRVNDNNTWYGVSLITNDVITYDPVNFSATRTSDTEATLAWADPGDAPDGMSILRVTGAITVDGNGIAFGSPGYDPTTIAGSAIIADNQTSPFVDVDLDAGTDYTYAIIRTGPGA